MQTGRTLSLRAGYENRTRFSGLGSQHNTIILIPHENSPDMCRDYLSVYYLVVVAVVSVPEVCSVEEALFFISSNGLRKPFDILISDESRR